MRFTQVFTLFFLFLFSNSFSQDTAKVRKYGTKRGNDFVQVGAAIGFGVALTGDISEPKNNIGVMLKLGIGPF